MFIVQQLLLNTQSKIIDSAATWNENISVICFWKRNGLLFLVGQVACPATYNVKHVQHHLMLHPSTYELRTTSIEHAVYSLFFDNESQNYTIMVSSYYTRFQVFNLGFSTPIRIRNLSYKYWIVILNNL